MLAKLLMALTMAFSAIGVPPSADVLQAGDHYLMVTDDGRLTMWEETNGASGLQAHPVLVLGIPVAEPDRQVHL